MKLKISLDDQKRIANGETVEFVQHGLNFSIEPVDYETSFKVNGTYCSVTCFAENFKPQLEKGSLIEPSVSEENMSGKIKVCDWSGHIQPYYARTTGKHPVHMIDGGSYLTEDARYSGDGDMGWFFLNAKDYAWFKANLKEVEATSGK